MNFSVGKIGAATMGPQERVDRGMHLMTNGPSSSRLLYIALLLVVVPLIAVHLVVLSHRQQLNFILLWAALV